MTTANTAGAANLTSKNAPAITTPLRTDSEEEISQRALSPSQITTWMNCRAAWWYKYALGIPDPPTASLALGRAIHHTIAAVLRIPVEDRGGAELPGEALAHLRHVLNIELDLVETLDEPRQDIAARAEAMLTALMPTLQSMEASAVELPLSGQIERVPLHGIADAISGGVVVDFKTASRKPSGISGAHRRQLAIYAALSGVATAKLITVTATKTPAVIEQSITALQVAAEVDHLHKLLPIVRDEIATGLYAPNRGSMFCSRHNCAFWRSCQREFGGLVEE